MISICALNGQNRITEVLYPKQIKTIAIEGDQIFEIRVTTSKTDKITLSAIVDGEYGDAFQIDIQTYEQSYKVKLIKTEFNMIADDKRNAHKVIAAALILEVPENFNLQVSSDVGFLKAQGTFKTLKAKLQNGYFSFTGEADVLQVETREGNINLVTQNTFVKAHSSNGAMAVDQVHKGANKAILNTVHGDIKVEQNR